MPEPSEPWVDRRRRARLRLLRMHFESRVGHIGGNLSCLDLLLVLHQEVLGPGDQFVLSKGHAAGALYITLWALGKLSDEELATFHKDGTRLAGHPGAGAIEGILFGTGSLGHGFGLAAGLALAKRLKGEPGHVYCLMSDGEWNEGSCWETLIFAHHHRLENLTIIVDLNGLQGFGTTREVADLGSLSDKFRSFSVPTREIDGHSREEIVEALRADRGPGPHAVVARTRKGSGVSFMEDRVEWHYLALSEGQYLQAVREVERA
jgi:transketolase